MLISLILFLLAGSFYHHVTNNDGPDDLPNILWITTEDHGLQLGAYGDSYAHTPAIDKFAETALRYDVAWSNAPVCAPARTALITGVSPTSTGGQHMRSDVTLPDFIRKYPILLREAGYYTTNNDKEDYNVSGMEQVWDESSEDAHYKNREDGQPFFAVFNFTQSHEYAIRSRTELPYHDPELAPVPPIHPDTPEVRRDWAQYYHGISNIDKRTDEILRQLEEDGLAEETIVFFYSDHGGGMPGFKRFPLNRGLHVPLLVHIPDKYRHLAPPDYQPGGATRHPVAFVDFAPTLLSLIGHEPPDWMQGSPFMGPYKAPASDYLYGFRDRMDERFDLIRSVRNDRYIYVRNYMPHLIYGQHLPYMFITQTTQIWQKLYNDGELVPPQTYFWEPKPSEELYDLENDPDEIVNLAESDLHKDVLNELRQAHREHILKIRDTGFLPEAEMHRRAGGQTIFEMAQDETRYPLERIVEIADIASTRDTEVMPKLFNALDDVDPAVRYWALLGFHVQGEEAFENAVNQIRVALNDENPSVQIAAAELFINFGNSEDVKTAVDLLVTLASPAKNGAYVGIAAMNVLSGIDDDHVERIRPEIERMAMEDPNAPDRPNAFVRRLVSIMFGEDIY